MEPEQFLELIRSAPERYESVRAALRYRGDGAVRKGDPPAHSAARVRSLC